MDSAELHAVDGLGCHPREHRAHDVGKGADEGRDEHRPRPRPREVRGAVQPDDGLARPRRPADAPRPVERAAHELGLSGVKEAHPLLDRAGEDASEKRLVDLVHREQLALVRFGARGGYDGLLHGRDDGRRGSHQGEQRQSAGQDGVDLDGSEPGAMRGDVPKDVLLPDDAHRPHALVDALPPGEHDDGADLPRCETYLCQISLGRVGEVGEVEDVVGHVLLAAVNPTGMDGDVLPGLGVDDEDAARADDNEVDLGTATARPAAVGQEMVADRGERGEGLDGLPLGDLSDGVAAGGCAGLGGGEFVLGGECELTARFGAGGVSCGHLWVPLRGCFGTPANGLDRACPIPAWAGQVNHQQ